MLSNRIFIATGAVFAGVVCMYLALRVATLLLPFMLRMSASPYRSLFLPLSLFLLIFGALLRARGSHGRSSHLAANRPSR